MKNTTIMSILCLLATVVYAEITPAELAAQSEAKSKASAATPATPEQVKERVYAAVALLEKEGLAALPKFKGSDSEFIFGGTYMAIRDTDGIQVMHPIQYKLEGKNVLENTDMKGNLWYARERQLVLAKGEAWHDYWWPKPGEKMASHKVSFSKLATVGDKKYIVTCGIYGQTDAQIEALMAGN